MPQCRVRPHLRQVLVMLSLLGGSIAFTWPMANLSQPQLPLHDDALFSVWRLAWVAHQLSVEPTALFDANVFYPEANTLAFSDAMLLLGVAGSPFIWLGAHPVVVHNVLLIASFAAAALATMHLLRFLGASTVGQIVAAMIFSFAPYRIGHIGHLELLWTAFIPLALVRLYRALELPTLRRGMSLGVVLAMQGLCSIYYVVFLVIWLIPATLTAPLHVTVTWSRRHVLAAVGALFIAGVLLGPYAYMYAQARQDVGARSVEEIQRYSAVPGDYLSVPDANRLYDRPSSESIDERSLFLGTVAMSLAIAAIVMRPTRAVIPYAVLGLIALDLSFGVNGLTYNALRVAAPSLDGFRAPARFAVFVLLSVAVLAGLAITHIRAVTTRRVRAGITVFAIVGILLEYWSAPLPAATRPLEPPAVYGWIATQPRAPILELPVPTPDTLWRVETTFQYFSIFHWQPLLNGYSGYAPPSYVRMLESVRDFPSAEAMQLLRDRGVQIVVLHERFMPNGEFDQLLAACGDTDRFTGVRVFHDIWLRRSAVCRVRQQ